MCGIVGVAHCDERKVSPDVLAAMIDMIRHRGPDAEGAYMGAGVGLASCRLSIVDLETGDQPISTEDDAVTLVCNGEIYNAPELRNDLEQAGHRFRTRSDVEVLLHLYEDQGIEAVSSLRGMFAFALWDARRRVLFLARDRLGIKPLYYAETGDAIWFGSEQKAILSTGAVNREIDPGGLHDYLRLGFVVAPTTMMKGIRQIPPASILRFHKGATSISRYWSPDFPRRGETDLELDAKTWRTVLLEKLDETVAVHLRSDVPVGAWLSPGVDSSAVVSLMHRHTSQPIHAVSLGYEDARYDERRIYSTLDRFPGYNLLVKTPIGRKEDLSLLPFSLWHAEDPSSSGLEIARQLLSRPTADDVKVILTGEGADEVFGGYSRFRVEKLLTPFVRLPLCLRRAVARALPAALRRGEIDRMLVAPPEMGLERYRTSLRGLETGLLTSLLTPDMRMRLEGEAFDWEIETPPEFSFWPRFAQMQYVEMKTRLPSLTIRTLDRATMAYSVEARVPFLDHELVELAARIPPRLKLRGLKEKAILREAVSPILPPEIVWRRKRGLRAPLLAWMERPLPSPFHEVMQPSALRKAGTFDADRVHRLMEAHRAGRCNGTYALFSVLVLQLWHEMFERGRGPLL